MSLINNKKSLIAAFVAGAFVFIIFGSITLKTTPTTKTSSNPSYQYVVANKEIKKGDIIKEEDVKIQDFVIDIEGAQKATGEVVGRKAATDIVPQKPIMKSFVEEIKVEEKPDAIALEPKKGFRAIPVLIKKSSIPPYLKVGSVFDLYTKENSMKIENLKILNVLDAPRDEGNKMLIVEIKNGDIPIFIESLRSTKGLILLQKNISDMGEYRFYSTLGGTPILKASNQIKKQTSDNMEVLPPISQIDKNIVDISNNEKQTTKSNNNEYNEVEIIVGNNKSKVEFTE